MSQLGGDSFHHKETRSFRTSGDKKQPKDFTVFLFPMKYSAKQCSYFTHTASWPLSKEGFPPVPQLFWGLHWGGRWGRRTHRGFCSCHSCACASDLPSGQKPVEMSSLTLLSSGTMKGNCLSIVYQKMDEQAQSLNKGTLEEIIPPIFLVLVIFWKKGMGLCVTCLKNYGHSSLTSRSP